MHEGGRCWNPGVLVVEVSSSCNKRGYRCAVLIVGIWEKHIGVLSLDVVLNERGVRAYA